MNKIKVKVVELDRNMGSDGSIRVRTIGVDKFTPIDCLRAFDPEMVECMAEDGKDKFTLAEVGFFSRKKGDVIFLSDTDEAQMLTCFQLSN